MYPRAWFLGPWAPGATYPGLQEERWRPSRAAGGVGWHSGQAGPGQTTTPGMSQFVGAAEAAAEGVRAQEGDFYGGWITNEIVGPFKGESGTQGW